MCVEKTPPTRGAQEVFSSSLAADGLTTSCAAANMDDLRVDTLFSSMDKKKIPNENIPSPSNQNDISSPICSGY